VSSLYAITEELVALDALLGEVGGDVSTPEGQTLEAWAEKFQWQMANKVDAYGALYKNMESDANELKAEIKRLSDRKKTLENRASRLLALAKFSMERLKTRKLEGIKFTISIQANGGVEPLEVLVDPKELPEQFRDVDMVYSPNDLLRPALEARRAALAKGEADPCPELAGKAELKDRGESVRVR
jgi:hypothetical protein